MATVYSGRVLGQLLVMDQAAGDPDHWNCICACGNRVKVNVKRMHDAGPKSCGCSYRDGVPKTFTAKVAAAAAALDAFAGDGSTAARDALARAIQKAGGVPVTKEAQDALIRALQQ